MAFVKIHGEILDSSVWSLPHATRIVWVTMLAMADEHGIVAASVDGLARRAVVSFKECETALKVFLGPDPNSRDGTTGERVEKVPGGWLVLNHAEYRDRRTTAQIATAERVRRHRKKREEQQAAAGVTANDVTPHLPTSPPEAEAEAEAEAESDNSPPTPQGGAGKSSTPCDCGGTGRRPNHGPCCVCPPGRERAARYKRAKLDQRAHEKIKAEGRATGKGGMAPVGDVLAGLRKGTA